MGRADAVVCGGIHLRSAEMARRSRAATRGASGGPLSVSAPKRLSDEGGVSTGGAGALAALGLARVSADSRATRLSRETQDQVDQWQCAVESQLGGEPIRWLFTPHDARAHFILGTDCGRHGGRLKNPRT